MMVYLRVCVHSSITPYPEPDKYTSSKTT